MHVSVRETDEAVGKSAQKHPKYVSGLPKQKSYA